MIKDQITSQSRGNKPKATEKQTRKVKDILNDNKKPFKEDAPKSDDRPKNLFESLQMQMNAMREETLGGVPKGE